MGILFDIKIVGWWKNWLELVCIDFSFVSLDEVMNYNCFVKVIEEKIFSVCNYILI